MLMTSQSFYRAFNAVYGKGGRLASVDVVVELLKAKCMSILSKPAKQVWY